MTDQIFWRSGVLMVINGNGGYQMATIEVTIWQALKDDDVAGKFHIYKLELY